MNGGTIGVCSGEVVRYADFCQALTILGKPDATRLIWAKTSDIAGNCNMIFRNFKGDWVWLIGDDHVFDPAILLRLLAHDVDVVVPLCLKRSPPYDPVVYSHQNADGHYVGQTDMPEHGLVEVYACGQAGMLIRREVIEAIEDPWFEMHGGPNEDLNFCAKVRDAGFRLWCDLDSLLGHMASHTVWPAYREEGWHADLHVDHQLTLPLRRYVKEPECVA
jgi:GT2 family glycosyltransferase